MKDGDTRYTTVRMCKERIILMLKFVTKEEFWKIEDQNPPLTPRHDLKHIQDVFSWNRLKDLSGVRIAEIGGGNSRLLPF